MNKFTLMLYLCLGRMRRMFFMSYPENEREYKKSRVCYIVGDTANQSIAQLTSGTFLVALMEYLKISDGNMGIVSSLVSLAMLGQLVSIKLAKCFSKNKLFVCLMIV